MQKIVAVGNDTTFLNPCSGNNPSETVERY